MSGELEAGGALITAGLASKALQDGEGHGHGDGGPCINCGTVLNGKFCGNCGQPAHIHRTLWHLVEEALHGILHFDGRFWHTLPKLTFRPGTLTHDYIEGRRARYISPLAAFLFTIFLMFFVFAMTGGPNIASNSEAADQDAIVAEVKADLAAEGLEMPPGLEAGLEAAAGPADADTPAQADVAASDAPADPVATPAPEDDVIYDEKADGTWQERWRRAVENGNINIGFGTPAEQEKIKKKLLNPDLLLYKFENSAYKFSFLLVPLSLPFVALVFLWKRGVTLFDHGVFVLYSLTFVSLMFMVIALMLKVPGGWLDGLATALPMALPVHMFFQLKGAYRLGWFSALWRTLFLQIAAMLCLSVFGLIIILIGLLG